VPLPGDAAVLLRALLPLLRGARIGATPPALTAEQARERLAQGRHLLQGLELDVDPAAAHELTLRLARALEAVPPAGPARRIREALERGDPQTAELLALAAAGARGAAAAVARERDLDPDLLWTLAQAAFWPALREWRRTLEPLAGGISWQRSTCFVCGAPAALGEVRADGGRHLRCVQCGAGWQIRRLQCPSCGNEDHATLRLFYEHGRHATRRVEACDRCRRYVKVVAAADPASEEELLLTCAATFDLDRVAQERGYEAGV
jgi:FdhE protein